MYKIYNFEENDDVTVKEKLGAFSVIEYMKDLSVTPSTARQVYYEEAMNCLKRQVVCDLSKSDVRTQKGAMQWSVGKVEATTGVKGVGDLVEKLVGSKMTGESAIKPEYKGSGTLVLEPTYKHILLEDLSNWEGGLVVEDGMFLACHSTAEGTITKRSNLSSAVLGNEGLFNLMLKGRGVVCLESLCPKEELITVELNDDVLKVDGSYAVAWSGTLQFTVERSGKSWVGSAASGEGLVNVYKGSGKVLLAPVSHVNSLPEVLKK